MTELTIVRNWPVFGGIVTNPSRSMPREDWFPNEAILRRRTGALILPSREIASWFRTSLRAALDDVASSRRIQRQTLLKRQTELTHMKDRLLTAYLAGAVDAASFQTKSTDLSGQLSEVEEALGRCGDIEIARGDIGRWRGDIAVAAFDWSQEAPAAWKRSKMPQKRAILDGLSLNRTLSATSLCLEKRKPFGFLAERPSGQLDRANWRSFEPALRGFVDVFLLPASQLPQFVALIRESA